MTQTVLLNKQIKRLSLELSLQIYAYIKPYEFKISKLEACKLIEQKFKILFSATRMNTFVKKYPFEYRYSKGKYRLFVDGDKNNYSLDNLLMVDIKVHEAYMNYLKKNKLSQFTGEALLTIIKAIELKTIVEKNKQYFKYTATNLVTGEVLTADSAKAISLMICNEAGAYLKRKTTGPNGGKMVKDWEVIRIQQV